MTGPRAFLFWSATMAGCSLLPDKAGVQDPDGDGWAWGEDCDSTRADVHPDGIEVCDDLDNDCDGLTDDADPDVSGQTAGFADADGDGYGDDATEVSSCELPADYVLVGDDCDDADSASFPGAPEEDCADPTDYNCDGSVGYEDADGDGSPACQDCDDASQGTTGGEVWYLDDDGDGYGDASTTQTACTQPSGYADNADDCDDADGATHPGAVDVCGDELVNDCGGSTADAMAECGLGGDVSLSEADAKLAGEDASDTAGITVSGAGDINGDGLADLLVGSLPRTGDCEGAAYLVLGSVTGARDLSEADATFVGEDVYDRAGSAVSGAGNVDGDEYDDVFIGAFNARNTGDSERNGCSETYTDGAGVAYLVLGPVSGEVNLGTADASLIGEASRRWAGGALSDAGDVNGDGASDLIVGGKHPLTGDGGDSNAAYVVFGPVTGERELAGADAVLAGEGSGEHAGFSVSGAGDVDGDGVADLVVGAPGGADDAGASTGRAYVVSGPVSSISLADADARLVGEASGDHAGHSVSGAGDVDGDGKDDVLVGAFAADGVGEDTGSAYVVLGPVTVGTLAAADAVLTGERTEDNAGTSVSGAGDVDGDGRGDLLIGAYQADHADNNAGAAYLVLAPVVGTLALAYADARLLGEYYSDYSGGSVSGAGDADGDGLADLLVGGAANDAGGSDSGAAYLVLGGGY